MKHEGNRNIMDGYFSYTIEQLEEDSNYTITLTAINAAGSAVSDPVTRQTREAGEGLTEVIAMDKRDCLFSFQLHLLLLLLFIHQMSPFPASLSSGGQWTASTRMGI